MASSPATKKRRVDEDEEEESDNCSDQVSSDEYDSEHEACENVTVTADFEALSLEADDSEGIQQLLQQLFLKAHIDLTELASLIVQQKQLGSVILQCTSDEDSDAEVDDTVYGFISVLNITEKKETACIKELKKYLQSKFAANDDSKLKLLQSMLNDDSKHIGFLFSERMFGIPARIAVPFYETLQKEILAAKQKNLKFDFKYILLLSKMFKPMPTQTHLPKASTSKTEYANLEEELFEKIADLTLDCSVLEEAGSAVSGRWDAGTNEDTIMPFRRLFVFRAEKFADFIENVKINYST